MKKEKQTVKGWFKSGDPWVWVNAAAVSISIIAVVGLLGLIAVKGLSHFWPKPIIQASYQIEGMSQPQLIQGEIVETANVPAQQLIDAGFKVDPAKRFYDRSLIKVGNRDVFGADFAWFLKDGLKAQSTPENLMNLERREWGNFYGELVAIKENGQTVESVESTSADELWQAFQERLDRALNLYDKIHQIEKKDIGRINYKMEKLRLEGRKLELYPPAADELAAKEAELAADRKALDAEYQVLQKELDALYVEIKRDSIDAKVSSSQVTNINLSHIVKATKPNALNVFQKLMLYFENLWDFLTGEPREANTEGGIYPAIFGTVVMVILMSVMVTPFGVIAAVYLREYAPQGRLTQIIRIAVNNLAGVPSIVYGVFGLGFFVYFIGQNIDQVLFEASLPSPTFGTPGLLWASLTLALLTLPVVIVATEEGLARIPRAVREGSLALGATKAETIWRIVLPMASPAMMTGLILAVARAAGEVAPLMLVGVVKLAPSLPVDGNFPFFHLDQKFMHLGFHIYDVGFQSPNVEAARPLVYATALLLVVVIAILNIAAVMIRNRLRERYKALEH